MSFADSENVTPELAHKIGMAFVRKMFGDDVQAVIATHVNTEHIHNHILINSYSLTGKQFYDNKASVRKMREVTNGVCRAFGVEPALNFENEGRSITYSEWQQKKNGRPMNLQSPYGWLKEFCEEYNFPFYGIHQFRHLHTSLLIGAGIDPTTVSGVLGHA